MSPQAMPGSPSTNGYRKAGGGVVQNRWWPKLVNWHRNSVMCADLRAAGLSLLGFLALMAWKGKLEV